MGLREDLLPVIDELRQLPNDFGLNRYAVKQRTRTWAASPGDGSTPVVVDVLITPQPEVTLKPPYAEQLSAIMGSGGTYEDRYFEIKGITPQYTDPVSLTVKGYTPDQLRPRAATENIELLYVLIGDDARELECTLVQQDFDDPFEYQLTVREKRHATSDTLVSIAVAPAPASMVHTATLQMQAIATYADGSTADVTAAAAWTSTVPGVATINAAGLVSGVIAGSSVLSCTQTGITSNLVSLTVT